MATREPIYVALWNLIANDPRITAIFPPGSCSRFLVHFEEVAPEAFPALFLRQESESWVRPGKGVSPKRTLRCRLFVYTWQSAPNDTAPATQINTVLDVLDDVLTTVPDPSNAQTLGRLVEHVYIEGDVQIAEGFLQNVSVATVPITILIP